MVQHLATGTLAGYHHLETSPASNHSDLFKKQHNMTSNPFPNMRFLQQTTFRKMWIKDQTVYRNENFMFRKHWKIVSKWEIATATPPLPKYFQLLSAAGDLKICHLKYTLWKITQSVWGPYIQRTCTLEDKQSVWGPCVPEDFLTSWELAKSIKYYIVTVNLLYEDYVKEIDKTTCHSDFIWGSELWHL